MLCSRSRRAEGRAPTPLNAALTTSPSPPHPPPRPRPNVTSGSPIQSPMSTHFASATIPSIPNPLNSASTSADPNPTSGLRTQSTSTTPLTTPPPPPPHPARSPPPPTTSTRLSPRPPHHPSPPPPPTLTLRQGRPPYLPWPRVSPPPHPPPPSTHHPPPLRPHHNLLHPHLPQPRIHRLQLPLPHALQRCQAAPVNRSTMISNTAYIPLPGRPSPRSDIDSRLANRLFTLIGKFSGS